jgi:hypothetical protein
VKNPHGTYQPGRAGWVKVKNEMNCIGRNIARAAVPPFALVSTSM